MSRERDYDAAYAAKEEIVVKAGGKKYEYGPEAPLDVAVEWMDRQTMTADDLGETVSGYMLGNYTAVIGKTRLAALKKAGVGSKTIDDIYRDLLDAWGLWLKPSEDVSEIGPFLDVLGEYGAEISKPERRVAFATALEETRTEVEKLEKKVRDLEDVEDESEAEEVPNSV
jgi:hypothetical protein